MKLNYKIVITGGSGRFGSILQKKYKSNKLFYPNKKQLNILSIKSIEKFLKKDLTKKVEKDSIKELFTPELGKIITLKDILFRNPTL